MKNWTERKIKPKGIVVNIRGSGGAGKSHLMRQFMKAKHAKPITNDEDKIIGYLLDGNIRVVGRYETACGGCDTIKTQDAVCNAVLDFAKKGGVIFEGYLVSGIYERYSILSKMVGGMIWAFLDTPLDEAIQRIHKRTGRDFNPNNTRLKHIKLVQEIPKAKAGGQRVAILPYKKALPVLLDLFKDG